MSDDSSPPPLLDVDNLRLSSRSPLPPYPSLPTPENYSPFPRAPESLIPRSGGHAIEPSALPNLACKRPSPLYCVNQRLCEELQVILLWKEVGEDDLGGGKGLSDKHALSYKRAISVRRPSLLVRVFVPVSTLAPSSVWEVSRSKPTLLDFIRSQRPRSSLKSASRSAAKSLHFIPFCSHHPALLTLLPNASIHSRSASSSKKAE